MLKVSNTSKVRELQVVDGQQRLTTLTLLLAALSRAVKAQNVDIDITPEELSDYYLNVRRKDKLRYKQLLTEHDEETLIQLLDGDNEEWFRITNGSEETQQVQLLEDGKTPYPCCPSVSGELSLF